ncbi:HrgA protein [Pasteurellaceae bacterium Pebbles2]|nr:HrgA protein [Pasteurellaceae bacterium Pebbles2]
MMTKKLTQPQRVIQFLKDNPNKRFTAREIAQEITKIYPEDYQEKRSGFNSERDFLQQIIAEIGGDRVARYLKEGIQTQDKPRPRVFWFSDHSATKTEKFEPKEIIENRQSEQALYPELMNYLHQEFGLFCLRINEKVSKKSRGANGNQWLHPDVVAMQTVDQSWNEHVKKCAKQSSGQSVKLWSFEVKVELNGSNVRSSFFQAVSNSSWANEGYLVATSIPDNILEELRILSALHGIGVILLVPNDLSQSEILLPAKQKLEVDWQSVNRIVTENSDFEKYIKYVSVYYQTGELFKNNWNK